jgi:dTDP-glucose 4,6-dehydratase
MIVPRKFLATLRKDKENGMTDVLVTGSLGLIGSNLCNELKIRGYNIIGCDIIHSGIENFIRCDVSEYRQLERLVESYKFDYVYHLAAEYGRWNGEDYYERLWTTNVIGTKNILRLQEKLKFRMIFFSSAEVYGDYDGVMTEDVMDKVPIKQMNDYAITKWAGELQCINSAKMFGTEIVRVRPSMCYGGHSYHPYRGVIAEFIHRAMRDEPYTVHLGHTRIFDYVEDTCKTFANIIDNFKAGEVYNVGGKEAWIVDMKTVSDIILRILGKDDSKVIYRQAEPFTTKDKMMDFSKARRDLKHDPKIDLEEGLRRTIEWVKQN